MALVQAGTYRNDRHKPDQRPENCNAPECPEWLSDDARNEWNRLIPDLIELGIELQPVDQDALSVYCDIIARHKKSPADTNAATLNQMRLIWEKYGMTNGSRQGLGLTGKLPEEKNPFK